MDGVPGTRNEKVVGSIPTGGSTSDQRKRWPDILVPKRSWCGMWCEWPYAAPHGQGEAKGEARFLLEVYERRHPRTDATVEQLIERHLTDADLGFKTRKNYRSQADKHIIPCIGHQKVRAVDANITDSFYSELRRGRDHCNRRPRIDHRTTRAHDCDERCKPDVCKPLSESSILYIHQILSGAFRRAVRGCQPTRSTSQSRRRHRNPSLVPRRWTRPRASSLKHGRTPTGAR